MQLCMTLLVLLGMGLAVAQYSVLTAAAAAAAAPAAFQEATLWCTQVRSSSTTTSSSTTSTTSSSSSSCQPSALSALSCIPYSSPYSACQQLTRFSTVLAASAHMAGLLLLLSYQRCVVVSR
jgi:hypothetical protein